MQTYFLYYGTVLVAKTDSLKVCSLWERFAQHEGVADFVSCVILTTL